MSAPSARNWQLGPIDYAVAVFSIGLGIYLGLWLFDQFGAKPNRPEASLSTCSQNVCPV